MKCTCAFRYLPVCFVFKAANIENIFRKMKRWGGKLNLFIYQWKALSTASDDFAHELIHFCQERCCFYLLGKENDWKRKWASTQNSQTPARSPHLYHSQHTFHLLPLKNLWRALHIAHRNLCLQQIYVMPKCFIYRMFFFFHAFTAPSSLSLFFILLYRLFIYYAVYLCLFSLCPKITSLFPNPNKSTCRADETKSVIEI